MHNLGNFIELPLGFKLNEMRYELSFGSKDYGNVGLYAY